MQTGRTRSSDTWMMPVIEVNTIITKPIASGRASLTNMKTTVASRDRKPASLSLRVVWSAAEPRSRFSRSATVRMRPIDVALVETLAEVATCSLRVFMRRVCSAFSLASIGGFQVIAVHSAQKTTNVATAMRTVKFFSEAIKSNSMPLNPAQPNLARLNLDRCDLVHDEDAQAHTAGRARGHHLAGRRREQRCDVFRRDQEQRPAHQERQAGHDQHGRAGLRGEGADLEAELLARAQQRAQVRQRLGEIAAGLALDRQRHDQKVELVGLNRARDAPQGLLDRNAELDLVLGALEHAADRLLDVARHVADRLLHRQAGA